MRNKLIAPFAILLLITPLVACGLLRRSSYKWHLVLEVDPAVANREAATTETVEVLNSRLNHLGLGVFRVAAVGAAKDGRLRVDLPDVADPHRLKNFIVARGSLQLAHVVSNPSPAPCQTYKTKDDAKSALAAAQDRQTLPYPDHGEVKWVVIDSTPIIEGRDLRTAAAVPDYAGKDYQITFTLKPDAATRFGAWTAANINQYISVVLNDEVKSIAFIRSQIFDTGQINGHFTKEMAEDLAQVLMSGPLPAAVKIVEEGRN